MSSQNTINSGGSSQYFLNPYSYSKNSANTKTEFYNLGSNGNFEQILVKSKRRNSSKIRVSGKLNCSAVLEVKYK